MINVYENKIFLLNLKKILIIIATFSFFMIPKYNLIKFSSSLRFGLRIDDFLAIVLFLIVTDYIFKYRNNKTVFTYYFLVISIFMSAIFSFYSHGLLVSFLFPFRFLEYFIFFFVGISFSFNKLGFYRFLYFLFYFQFLFSILQYFGLIGGIYATGEVAENIVRIMGTFGGAWELAPTITLLSMVLSFYELENEKIIRAITVLSVGFLVVLMAASRIGIVAHIFIIILFLKQFNLKSILVLLIFFLFGLFFIFSFSDRLIERSQGLQDMATNISFISDYYEKVIPFNKEYELMFDTNVGDLSWQIRIMKWTVAVKSFLSNKIYILGGIGPGYMGSALDGGWLRILTENGILSFIVFLSFLKKISKIDKIIKFSIIILSFHMIFIDINYASKFMSLFFLVIGYFFAEKKYKFYRQQLFNNFRCGYTPRYLCEKRDPLPEFDFQLV